MKCMHNGVGKWVLQIRMFVMVVVSRVRSEARSQPGEIVPC